MKDKINLSNCKIKENVEINNFKCDGDYYIGDPCYVLKDIENKWFWSIFCKTFDSEGVYEINGEKLFIFETAHGDGEYECETYSNVSHTGINNLCVDSGLLVVIPLTLINRLNNMSKEDIKSNGMIIYFDNEDISFDLIRPGCLNALGDKGGEIKIFTD